ncbi:MAG: glycosyltransferase family 2 protein, partial [Planktomarina sp.]
KEVAAQKLEYEEVIETFGVKIPYVPQIITPKIEKPMRNNRYEGGECQALRDLLQPGDHVLELGAGVGLLSTVAAMSDGVKAVTTVEANPEMIPLINETHRLNGVTNVEVLNGVATTEDVDSIPFYIRPDFWASSMEPDSRGYSRVDKLRGYNVEALIAEKKPTVIACDIEGGELGLFDKCDLSGVRAMILEMHPKVYGERNREAIVQLMRYRGLEPVPNDKPSSVVIFLRDNDRAHTELRTDLFEHRGDPVWREQDARFLVTTCMKDEGPFILEWLAWHKSIGIQDYIVFSNDCTDGTDEMLDYLAAKGELRHLENPAVMMGSAKFQPIALNTTHHMREMQGADFVISIDVDEFINIRAGKGHMNDLLAETGPFDALSISEINHGTNYNVQYERGLVTEQFPHHQMEWPGQRKARRGVKTITRISDRVGKIRNHRPDFRPDAEGVVWLDGEGRETDHFIFDGTQNGHNSRGTYGLAVLDHFALRSAHSYLVKMFRGDVVVKDKMVSQRYFRNRDMNGKHSSTFERQQEAFQAKLQEYMSDPKLKAIHDACCQAHEDRIAELLTQEVFQTRMQWILEDAWNGEYDADGNLIPTEPEPSAEGLVVENVPEPAPQPEPEVALDDEEEDDGIEEEEDLPTNVTPLREAGVA